MPVRIYAEDTYAEVANKIFFEFELNQSCAITGLVRDGDEIEAKGKYVLDQLRWLDEKHNTTPAADGRRRRKRKLINDSIGGYAAHKIFKFKITDNGTKYSIWRIQ